MLCQRYSLHRETSPNYTQVTIILRIIQGPLPDGRPIQARIQGRLMQGRWGKEKSCLSRTSLKLLRGPFHNGSNISLDQAPLVPTHFEPAVGVVLAQHARHKFFSQHEIIEKVDREGQFEESIPKKFHLLVLVPYLISDPFRFDRCAATTWEKRKGVIDCFL
jgi:hypothetical protein